MTQTDLTHLLRFAESLADLARPIAREHFDAQLRRDPRCRVDTKADRTPVTAADRKIERVLRERIAATFPEHGVLGEEEGADRVDAEWLWVLDPIDGTKAFTAGNPLFGTLIGLMQAGRPVLGVLEAPALKTRWSAAVGLGAWSQGQAVHVRTPRRLADAVLCCTTAELLLHDAGHRQLRAAVQWTNHGGDCLAYGFLARGGIDLIADRGLQTYDWCALVPIITQAGGVITDWRGRPLHLGSDGDVVAATDGELARAACALLGTPTPTP